MKPIQAKYTEKKFRKKYQESPVKGVKFKPVRESFRLSIFFNDLWMWLKPVRNYASEKTEKIVEKALDIFITKYGWILLAIAIIGIAIILWSLA